MKDAQMSNISSQLASCRNEMTLLRWKMRHHDKVSNDIITNVRLGTNVMLDVLVKNQFMMAVKWQVRW